MKRHVMVLALLAVASVSGAQQNSRSMVSGDKAQVAAELSGLTRNTVSFTSDLERAVFNPRGLRVPASQRLSSLDRTLEPGEQVIVLEPTRFIVSPGGAPPNHGIEVLWEVLSTDQGNLVAVPVPVLGSFLRVAKVCEDCAHDEMMTSGKCASDGYCLGTLPEETKCMNLMNVPDPPLVIRECTPQKKTAASLQANVDFVVSYSVRYQGAEGWIAIWGTASERPVRNVGWAGALVPGTGYFLDGIHDAAGVAGSASAATATVDALVAAQGPAASEFAYGIKEKGIK
jgi:hypothetical protein